MRSQNQGIRHYQELLHNNHNNLLKTLTAFYSRGQEQQPGPTTFNVFGRAQEDQLDTVASLPRQGCKDEHPPWPRGLTCQLCPPPEQRKPRLSAYKGLSNLL